MKINRSFVCRPTILTLAITAAFSSQVVWADDNESVQLEAIKVTSNTVTPETNSVSAEQIEKLQATDLQDLFSQSPEVTIGGGPGFAQKLYVRGIEDQLLNITIDGAQQATRQFHHAGRISIEPELLKRVEVNAGAGNALSGPGALGGSVKFVTKDPEDMLKPGENFGGLVKGMFSSNTDSFKTSTTLFGKLTEDWSGMVSYTQSDVDNYEDGNGDEVLGTEADQEYLFAKVVGHLTDSQTVRLSYEKHKDEGDRTQRPQWIFSPPPLGAPANRGNLIYPIDSERKTATFNYELNPLDNAYLDLALTIYNTETEFFQDGFFGPFTGTGESTGFDLRNTSVIGMHKVTYGVDYREDESTADGDGENYKDKSKVKGVYLQDDIQLTDALLLSAGLRYDDYELDTDFGNTSHNESDVSSNIGLNYHFTDNWSAFASYAEAFKGPLAQDAFKLGFTTQAEDLKPEKAENIEFGVAYDSATWFGSAKAYRSEIKDVIGVSGTVGPARNIFDNLGELKSDGYILELGHRWDSLMARVSYHYNDAEVDGVEANAYDHNGIANTVRDTVLAQLEYQLNSQWNFGWNARFVKGRDDIDFGDQATYPDAEVDQPGYGVHDFYTQWIPSTSEDFRITLTIHNIFNKDYIDHASVADFTNLPGYGLVRGYNEPGRDVRLSVAWQF
ncbi:TonB-dependent receptor domain-containing protein [Methylophaga sp. SB9B]|uniref:TonB-dependent receptor domain-containing protein n=1 Tax=Methylophaga sp. SB9B TaxID=2570356 RepID=UPI001FFF3DAA|nr:TonB-dependent receptor [Methylophaga sp. SB9B]